MDLRLDGRHALVCGASQGIGRACAVELAQLGASVSVLARSAERLRELAETLPRTAGQHHGWRSVDMLDSRALADAAIDIAAAAPIHILINNTGGPPGGPIVLAEPEAFEAAFRQHLIAGQVLAQAVLPGMRAAGYGRLVNVISTSVKEPLAGLGVSNTVRAAVAAWSKTLAGEVAADSITVNNVLPGYTRTQRLDGLIAARAERSGQSPEAIATAMLEGVPAKRFAEPAEIAAVAAFLCTPAAAYVNGASILVDGGRSRALS